MLYTSYFGNIDKILAKVPNAKFLSIAGRTPDNFNGKKFYELMPKYSWWKDWHDKFEDNLDSEESRKWYVGKYTSTVLDKLDPKETARKLKDLTDWQPTFMLCYEAPDKFCHRHIVADWFTRNCILCEEWVEMQ